jgi:hypothetical protein
MSFPVPSTPHLNITNPLESFISSFNTNSYFIGIMMLILNLGGRHLATGLTIEQDKVFQNVWFRRFLLFVVVFIATRNIFAAFWLSIAIIIILGYLTNEHSNFYVFGDPVPQAAPPPPAPVGLSPEEAEIYKRLDDRVNKAKKKSDINESVSTTTDNFLISYLNTMKAIQG